MVQSDNRGSRAASRGVACRGLAGLIAAAALALAAVPGARAQTAPAAAAQPSTGCPQTPPALRFTEKVKVLGETRTALVNLPPGRPPDTPLPVVLVFHGAGGSGLGIEADTGFSSMGDSDGFIAVYPNSDAHYWQLHGQHDFIFVRALLEQLGDTLCLDDSRIYAAGLSNGASLVARLGCELSDRLAAIAPVAGGDGLVPGCQPTRPVSVLEIHGDEDESVPYDGSSRFDEPSVWNFLGAWSRWDGCSAAVSWKRLIPRALYATKGSCADGSAVAHIKLLREPHAWPSLSTTARGEPTLVAFSARQAIWQFFTTHTVSA